MYLFELMSGSILLALIFHDAFEDAAAPTSTPEASLYHVVVSLYVESMVVDCRANGIRRSSRYVSEPLWTAVACNWFVGFGLILGFALIQHSLSFGATPFSAGANFLLSGAILRTSPRRQIIIFDKIRLTENYKLNSNKSVR